MSNNTKIDVDFSKLEKVEKTEMSKTIKYLTGIYAVMIIVSVIGTICLEKFCNCGHATIIILLTFTAICFAALCWVAYNLEAPRTIYALDEKKADAALRRKLAEEAIIREIKIREKQISEAQKSEHGTETSAVHNEILKLIENIELLNFAGNNNNRKDKIKKTFGQLKYEILKLKDND